MFMEFIATPQMCKSMVCGIAMNSREVTLILQPARTDVKIGPGQCTRKLKYRRKVSGAKSMLRKESKSSSIPLTFSSM